MDERERGRERERREREAGQGEGERKVDQRRGMTCQDFTAD